MRIFYLVVLIKNAKMAQTSSITFDFQNLLLVAMNVVRIRPTWADIIGHNKPTAKSSSRSSEPESIGILRKIPIILSVKRNVILAELFSFFGLYSHIYLKWFQLFC